MTLDHLAQTTRLAQDLIRIDSRSPVSNAAIADRLQPELRGFEIERLPYTDPAGVTKHVLVAARGWSGLALCGHMDTVPDTGWTRHPFDPRIEGDTLHGLGSADMKGPLAAMVVAMRAMPPRMPVALFLTTDEETTKQGARILLQSELARRYRPRAFLIAEPTQMIPVRGHRASVAITAIASGTQAHSSTGRGRNANWALIPFLAEVAALQQRLLTDPAWQDPAYDPPHGDLNLVLDNHGTAVNVTVPRATARMKLRFSASLDPAPILKALRAAAARAGLHLIEQPEGPAPELAASHKMVRIAEKITRTKAVTAPFGTDAVVLQKMAPCVLMGPGDIGTAHTPGEHVSLSALAQAVPVYVNMAKAVAAG